MIEQRDGAITSDNKIANRGKTRANFFRPKPLPSLPTFRQRIYSAAHPAAGRAVL
jgi:hypothetical protein